MRQIDKNGDVVGLHLEFVMDRFAHEYEQGSGLPAHLIPRINQALLALGSYISFFQENNHESGFGEHQQACLPRRRSACVQFSQP